MLIIYKVLIKFFFIILLVFPTQAAAKVNDDCNQFDFKDNFKYLTIDTIEIEINEYRKWQVNNIRILTSDSHLIPDKFKKKFKGKIFVKYKNNLRCAFKAKIRTQGDLKDHILYKKGQVFQSLDVKLLDGHINNITKFKLFLKKTRGKENDEIFMTELLRELDYIAPRTQIVNVRINDQNIKMLFQEKVSKELLEFHKRREGPILEGDEKYMMKAASKISSVKGIDWSGIFRVSELATKIQLSKLTNSSWAIRNNLFKENSLRALKKLNFAYLVYLNGFKNNKNDFFFLDYNLDNNILAQNSDINRNKLDIFNNLILSGNGNHALYVHNRKFYWNSVESYFEPIYYDGEFNLEKKQTKLNYPLSKTYQDSINQTKKLIINLDKNKFYNKLLSKNLALNKKVYNQKFDSLLLNLNLIEKLYTEKDLDELDYNNNFYQKEKLFNKYLYNLKNQKKLIKFLQYDREKNTFQVCSTSVDKCNNIFKMNTKALRKFLESDLRDDGIYYQFLDFKNKTKKSYNKIQLNDEFFNNVTFFYNDAINFNLDKKKKTFKINQKNSNGRGFFVNGSIKNIKIDFEGNKDLFNQNIANRYDENLLTGCLSFIKIEFEDTELDSKNSICEDGINLINTKGKIKSISSQNSLFDGIDFDFSNLSIDKIEVQNSLNDCIDFSSGIYVIKRSTLRKCGDKGISVGEDTKADFKKIEVSESNIGLASKDSSRVVVGNSYISDVKNCYASYKKKQEFNGGQIKINKSICKNFDNEIYVDNFSSIKIQ